MKKFKILVLAIILIFLTACSQITVQSEQSNNLPENGSPEQKTDKLYQVSTLDALLAGIYDGDINFQQLSQEGDFGLGTLNNLDGEMLALDGKFYQIAYDGSVNEIDPKTKTPFAQVNYFKTDDVLNLNEELNFADLENFINDFISTDNLFYAIKATGQFKYIKTRSVPKQEKPYPKLVDVVPNQATFEFNDIKGTLVAYKSPSYMQGIGVPGYHFHFINEDKTGGGHVLDLTTEDLKIEIDQIPEFEMDLLESQNFYEMDFSQDKTEEAAKVEKE